MFNICQQASSSHATGPNLWLVALPGNRFDRGACSGAFLNVNTSGSGMLPVLLLSLYPSIPFHFGFSPEEQETFKTHSDVTPLFKGILSPLGNAISPAKLSYSLNTSN